MNFKCIGALVKQTIVFQEIKMLDLLILTNLKNYVYILINLQCICQILQGRTVIHHYFICLIVRDKKKCMRDTVFTLMSCLPGLKHYSATTVFKGL